jgi:Tfp pilus assembly PilM family ATPase
VDIGSDSVKLVALSRCRRRWRIESASVLVRTGTDDQAFAESLLECVSAALAALPRSERKISASVPACGVFIKSLTVPAVLSECEAQAWMEQEAARQLPFAASELYFDWYRRPGSPLMILLACHRAALDKRLAPLRRLRPAMLVDVDALALGRGCGLFMDQAQMPEAPLTLMLMDMGASGMRLHVLCNGDLLYSNEQPLPRFADQQADTLQHLLVLRAKHLMQLSQAVCGAEAPSHILFTGGYAASPGLARKLSEALGLPVCTPDLSHEFIVEKKVDSQWLRQNSTSLALACGLAMGESA